MNDNRQPLSRNVEFALFAISATAFGLVAIVSVIVFGEPDARNAAIASALLASASQFVGSNTFNLATFRLSLGLGWAAFASLAAALALLVF